MNHAKNFAKKQKENEIRKIKKQKRRDRENVTTDIIFVISCTVMFGADIILIFIQALFDLKKAGILVAILSVLVTFSFEVFEWLKLLGPAEWKQRYQKPEYACYPLLLSGMISFVIGILFAIGIIDIYYFSHTDSMSIISLAIYAFAAGVRSIVTYCKNRNKKEY